MKHPSYLRLRPNSRNFQFRIKIPADVRQFYDGQPTHFERSLHTADLHEACALGAQYAAGLRRQFEALRARAAHEAATTFALEPSTAEDLLPDLRQAFAHLLLEADRKHRQAPLHLHPAVQAYRAKHPETVPWSDAAVLAQVHRDHIGQLQLAAQQDDWSVVDSWLPNLLGAVRVQVDANSAVYQQLRHAMFTQYQSVALARQLRDEGVYVESPAPPARFAGCFAAQGDGVRVALPPRAKLAWPSPVLLAPSRSTAPFTASSSASITSSSAWSASAASAPASPPSAVLSADTPSLPVPVSCISRAEQGDSGPTLDDLVGAWAAESSGNPKTLAQVKREMQSLAAFTRQRYARGLAKADIVAFKNHELTRVQPITVKRIIGLIRAVFSYACDNDLLPSNPCDGVKVKLPRNAPAAREPFDADDLHRIFSHPLFTRKALPTMKIAGGLAAYWLPLMALVTGARLEELGQCDVRDVGRYRVDGEPYLSLTIACDPEKQKTTKTAASNRTIPIPSLLIRLGFADYVASLDADGPLFPDLVIDCFGIRTSRFSTWFNAMFLRKTLGITSPTKVFYSFRHTFISAGREVEMSDEVRRAIEGHAKADVASRYGVVSLRAMRRFMDKMEFPGFPL
jgi:integrase